MAKPGDTQQAEAGISQAEFNAKLAEAVEAALTADRASRHKDNPWDHVFERVQFATGDGAIFPKAGQPANADGSTQKRAAEIAYVFAGGIGSIAGTIYLTKMPNSKNVTVEAKITGGGRFKKLITPNSDASRDSLNAFLKEVGAKYLQWRKGHTAAPAAQAKASSASVDGTADLADEQW